MCNNNHLLCDLCTCYDPPSENCFFLGMCVRCELWLWQTLKDKPSLLLSYVYVSWKERARRVGGRGGGLRILWQRGLVSLKRASVLLPLATLSCVSIVPMVFSCFAGLVWSLECCTEWSFPSWNIWGSAGQGVTAQVRSPMNCLRRKQPICRRNLTACCHNCTGHRYVHTGCMCNMVMKE